MSNLDDLTFLVNNNNKVQGLSFDGARALIQGGQGPPGPQGAMGAQGSEPVGPPGEVGPTGAQGGPGSSGTVTTATSSSPTFSSSGGTQPVFTVIATNSRINFYHTDAIFGFLKKILYISGVIHVNTVTNAGTGHYRIAIPNSEVYASSYYPGSGPHILGPANINGTAGYIGISPDDAATNHLSLFTTPTGSTAVTCGVTDGLGSLAASNYYAFSAIVIVD